MRNKDKTKEQLIDESERMRQRIVELQALEHRQKKAEKISMVSKELFEKTFLSLDSAIFILDNKIPPTILDSNPAASKIFGYNKEEILGRRTGFLHINKKTLSEFKEILFPIIEKQGHLSSFEFKMKRKNGKIFPTEHSLFPLEDVKGNRIGWVSVVRDITERKKTEQALQESEKRYRFFAENVIDVIWTMDMNLRFTYISPSVEYLFGYSVEEMMALNLNEILTPSSFEIAMKTLTEELAIEKMKEKDLFRSRTLELEHIHKNGSKGWAEVKVTPIRDSNNCLIGILGVSRDITERKKAEKELQDAYQKLKTTQEQLIQSSKMVAMGQLAAGISHELSQPLTGIKGFSQAALADLDRKNPVRKDLKKILGQSERMTQIIKSIRLFARKSDFQAKKININQPIENSLILLNQQLKFNNIKVKKFLAKDLPKIAGDSNQLQQVFLNLITNARDAIDRLRSPKEKELIIKSYLNKDTGSVEVILQDTGCGIPKEDLAYIFDPFFTTKSIQGGMGLGLSIGYRIIENHKGTIEAHSVEGRGATFKIALPVA